MNVLTIRSPYPVRVEQSPTANGVDVSVHVDGPWAVGVQLPAIDGDAPELLHGRDGELPAGRDGEGDE